MNARRVLRKAAMCIAVSAILLVQTIAPAAAAAMSRCDALQLAEVVRASDSAPNSAALCKAACLGQDTLFDAAAKRHVALDLGAPTAVLSGVERPAIITATVQPDLLQRICSPPVSVLFCSYRE